ncbi:hypothetical protein D9758_004345 [Tetrapyrgos nigripes]|uniref:Uncharacterized protein n=1 Tax=Tetrapyrgos nigripes TaxID=182062 RepID=A0A8H5LSM7_9AGAR|nr:hypothetical protein D9758_004345 [Tetrapyrgos nigripes]
MVPPHSFKGLRLYSSILTLSLLLNPITAVKWISIPSVSVSEINGWKELPIVPGADLITDFPIEGTSATFPVYQSSGLDNEAITRAVIVSGAQARDHWSHFITIENVLNALAGNDSSFDPKTISILSPCFLDQADYESGAANASNLYWSSSGWFTGHTAVGPEMITVDGDHEEEDEDDRDKVRKRDSQQVNSGATSISSFDVLDNIANHYMDKETYPNLQEIIFVGHSAAAQLLQRYAALRKPTDNDESIHFMIANPGTYLWLTSDRPVTVDSDNSSCSGIDDYKYGMSSSLVQYSNQDFAQIGRKGVVKRYRERNVHYAFGTADFGVGDYACQAMTQGATHLDRGMNFIMLLQSMVGGVPTTHTVDWIDGIGHDFEGMMDNEATSTRLFRNSSASSTGEQPATTSVYITTASASEYDGDDENNSGRSVHAGWLILTCTISTLSAVVGVFLL